MRQDICGAQRAVRQHIALAAFMQVVWVSRRFWMMRRVIPAFAQFASGVLPLVTVFSYLQAAGGNLETFEQLEQAAIALK